VRGPEELERAFAERAWVRPDALLVEPNALTVTYGGRIAALATERRLPTMGGGRWFVDAGGLMAYGPSLQDHYPRAVAPVDKILKGAKPAELPVQQPTQFELVINLKTAEALGLVLPQHLLVFADEVTNRRTQRRGEGSCTVEQEEQPLALSTY
jgi:putative tryptophan/tyrosine transport system substrate-binding protein